MSYSETIKNNQKWIDEVWEKLDKKLSRTAVKNKNKIPYTTVNGDFDDHSQGKSIIGWTNGFWGGLMWLMYNETKKECYRETAEISEKLLDGCFDYVEDIHHDVGFMWHLTAGASYRITANNSSKNRNLLAAMSLMSRYNVEGNYIRAWNGEWFGEKNDGWTIIDCMMNLPLLYWASDITGDERFKHIAVRHADMAMRDHIRPDGSVNHIVVHDTLKPDTVIEVKGGQGYAPDSCWSRGLAWALYGFVITYNHTGEQKYLDTAKKVAHYYISNVAATDWKTLLDFRAPEEPVYYDSTAGVISACGLIEIAKCCPDEQKDMYLKPAVKILHATEKNWCNWEDNEDSIVQMGSEMYSRGIHKPIIYGDFFFAEAILKLKGSEFNPW